MMQRMWIGLSVSGDEVSIARVPDPIARTYLQSLDLEVGFVKRGQEIAEQFSTDEMAKNFIRAFSGMIFAVNEILVFDFHGQNLKAVVRGLSVVELANGASNNMGILMEKTDVSFIRAGDSSIKLKSSAKK
jgi:vesicle-fusing ATPase